MIALGIFEQNDRPFRRHEGPATRRMQGPDLHVGRIERITDIDRVIEQRCRAIMSGKLFAQPAKAIGTDGVEHGSRDRTFQRPVSAISIQILAL